MITVYWLETDNCLDGEQTYERDREFTTEEAARKFEAFLDVEGSEHWRNENNEEGI
jgi:hypothetical protein